MVGSPEQQLGTPKQVPVAANRTPVTAAAASTARPDRQAIKIRVVSWNLGDSLPKGDLATLLGEVPPYHPPDHLVTSFPNFDSTDGDHHPYHVIVVAAQECPSASGVPRGLAAGVAKGVIGGLKEKEKLREKEKAKEAEKAEKAEKAWIAQMERLHGTGTEDSSHAGTPIQETSPSTFTFPARVPPKDDQPEVETVAGSLMSTFSAEPSIAETRNEPALSTAAGTEEDSSAEGPTTGGNPLQLGSLPTANTIKTPHHGHHTPHITTGNKGWSDLLEDYLCRGVKYDPKARTRRSGSISFRQGSISGSLPSTPSQVPGYNPFFRGGSGPSPSPVPEGVVNTPIVPEGAERRPSTFSTSPQRLNSASPTDRGACLAPTTGDPTPRRSIPMRSNGLVPPPAVVKPVRSRSGSEAPPSPTFSFELQTPTPMSEVPPTVPAPDDVYGFNPGMYSGQPSTTDGTTISPMSSYRSGIQPSSSIMTSTMAEEPESALAPKPSDAIPQSLIASTAPAEKRHAANISTDTAASRSIARESGRMALPGSSEAAGYFTAVPGLIKDKRLTPLQIPSSGSPGHSGKPNAYAGTSANHSQATSGASSTHSKNATGPYHFLVKERLLGLYLAIFVHRDCKDWVKGFDHDYVPAGLAGGRIGNKGGIGMSLNMAGHRFLFVNSHLAAHAHRVNARIANVEKIKSELHLDCFLPESDPRAQAEDITDRYDTVFWMGDLNFRLDISRLHADWLVSRKEYAQALEFDQLRSAMLRGDVFDGFSEAPIDFAPTFKYDVWRSAKRTRSIRRKTEAKVREKDKEARKEGGEAILEVDEECETDNNFTDDQSSMITGDRRGSVDTSALSTIAGTASEGEDSPTAERYTTVAQPHRPVTAVAKTTAIKAKHRFMKFIKSATPPVSIPSSSTSSRSAFTKSASPSRSAILSPPDATAWPAAPDVTTHTYPADLFENRRQSVDSTYSESFAAGTSSSYRPGIRRQLSTKIKRRFSTSQHNNQDANDDDTSSSSEEDIRRGVYDSSSKQRVPSWCDRVLWKTIIEKETSQTSPTSANLLNVEGKITRIGHNLVSKLHLRRDISPTDTTPHDGVSRAATHLSLTQREQPPEPTQLVPAAVNTGGAAASRATRSLGLQSRGFSQPGYASSNPGSSDDSSPAASILDPDSFTRPRLADKVKHRSISGVMLRSPSSTTATTHEHGNRHSGMYTTSPSAKGDHAFLRSRTIGDIPHRTDTLHSLFGGDGVETSIATAKKWFNHLVRPRSDIDVVQPDHPPSPEEEPEPPKRKGEVVCLKYDTLDDADMRRLEGRSDHRPIIFAAAVYI